MFFIYSRNSMVGFHYLKPNTQKEILSKSSEPHNFCKRQFKCVFVFFVFIYHNKNATKYYEDSLYKQVMQKGLQTQIVKAWCNMWRMWQLKHKHSNTNVSMFCLMFSGILESNKN